jgi:antitoxin component YwqK of YwqJK toxin-antitoxin module
MVKSFFPRASLIFVGLLGLASCASRNLEPAKQASSAVEIEKKPVSQDETAHNQAENKAETYRLLFKKIMTDAGFDTDFINPGENCQGKFKDKLTHNQWGCYSADKKKRSTAWLKSGKLAGWVRTWNPDGKIESEAFWENSKLNGPAFKFYPNGVREISATFKNDLLNGLVILRNEKNRKVWSSFFEDGLQSGKERLYYEGGFVKTRAFYLNGLKSGSYTEWYESGKIKLRGSYSKGKPNGVWTFWENEKNANSKSGTFEELQSYF